MDNILELIEDGREIIVIKPNNGNLSNILDTIYSLDYNIEINTVDNDIMSIEDLIWYDSIVILPNNWWTNYNAHAILDKIKDTMPTLVEWRCENE